MSHSDLMIAKIAAQNKLEVAIMDRDDALIVLGAAKRDVRVARKDLAEARKNLRDAKKRRK